MRRTMGAIIAAAALALTACGSSPADSSSRSVTRADLGDSWPLTVDAGTLNCVGSGGSGAVTIEVDGTVYALNGVAKGQGAGQDVTAIWAANPDIDGARLDLGPLISEGLGLCH